MGKNYKNYTWHVNLDKNLKIPMKMLSAKKNMTIQELISEILHQKTEQLKREGVLSW